jgi:hypothetical protein
MAEIIGYLREDRATRGEKEVLRKLKHSLPQDFYVYVECPLQHDRIQRFPDFIVLSNFGVVVLEVKDWVQIEGKVDKYRVKIHRRDGKVMSRKNPVLYARDYAIVLAEELQKIPSLLKNARKLDVPWGYAVVFPNLPMSVITQLQSVWGERYVLGLGDLEPHLATKRLKATLPYHRSLHRHEIQCVRGVINPSVLIAQEQSDAPALILDQEQERIVSEPPQSPVLEKPEVELAVQETMFQAAETQALSPAGEEAAVGPPMADEIVFNAAIRLVRGVAGSGKTLVLVRRAQYLAAQHPEWRIGVLTYNSELAKMLRGNLKGITPIKRVSTFHGLCSGLLKGYIDWKEPQGGCAGWLANQADRWPVVNELGVEFVDEEVRWIKEMAIPDRATYLECERKGRGQGLRGPRREAVYEVLGAYQGWLKKEKTYDWADVPHLVLQGMDDGKVGTGGYDAILIDEAQDFAPVWIEVIKRSLKPDGGLLFLVDDPSQSIYRYYSWREKGVPVVGRTRWLRVPYRNTRQIYQAAYEVIRDDEILKQQLQEHLDIAVIEPDLTSQYLRSGRQPELRRFPSVEAEFSFIRCEIEDLLQKGLAPEQIAVLHRRKSGERRLKRHLRGLGVKVSTFHALKGLEYEVVFLGQMQETFQGMNEVSDDQLSSERRLVYMAMTRPRERLYLNYEGSWPPPLAGVLEHVDRVLT